MKTRITLSLDADLVAQASEQAQRRGVSLASFVEDALRTVTSDAPVSIVDRWAGRFTLADRGDARYEALAAKYDHPPVADQDDGSPHD